MEWRSQALAVYLHQMRCSDIRTPCLGAFGVSCKTPLHVTTAQTEGTPKAGVLQVRNESLRSSCPPFLKCFCQLFTDLFHWAQGKRGHWGVLPCSGHFLSSQDRLWGRHNHLCFGRLTMGSFKKKTDVDPACPWWLEDQLVSCPLFLLSPKPKQATGILSAFSVASLPTFFSLSFTHWDLPRV